jgi:hypothetical protein
MGVGGIAVAEVGGVCFHNGEAKLLEGISVGVHASVYEEREEILDLTFVLLQGHLL